MTVTVKSSSGVEVRRLVCLFLRTPSCIPPRPFPSSMIVGSIITNHFTKAILRNKLLLWAGQIVLLKAKAIIVEMMLLGYTILIRSLHTRQM